MPRRLLKKLLPHPHHFLHHKRWQALSKFKLNSNLWHLNRNSVATAVSIGIFTAFMPIPCQMIMAGLLAILLQANLPIAVLAVWISNPFTYAPIFYFAYKVGSYLLAITDEEIVTDTAWQWLTIKLGVIWQPLILGIFVCAITGAIISNLIVRGIWRWSIHLRWRARRQRQTQQTFDFTIE
ncbi:MAG: DUF2062 domain-containing protein [Legionellales bacterium]|nr:DUF2062 domain-containing protein [Legionellales bacterium]